MVTMAVSVRSGVSWAMRNEAWAHGERRFCERVDVRGFPAMSLVVVALRPRSCRSRSVNAFLARLVLQAIARRVVVGRRVVEARLPRSQLWRQRLNVDIGRSWRATRLHVALRTFEVAVVLLRIHGLLFARRGENRGRPRRRRWLSVGVRRRAGAREQRFQLGQGVHVIAVVSRLVNVCADSVVERMSRSRGPGAQVGELTVAPRLLLVPDPLGSRWDSTRPRRRRCSRRAMSTQLTLQRCRNEIADEASGLYVSVEGMHALRTARRRKSAFQRTRASDACLLEHWAAAAALLSAAVAIDSPSARP